MSPQIVDSYSPQQNSLIEQNQVTSTLDNNQPQDLQNPMLPMPQNQASQSSSQPPQSSTEMSNMGESLNVGIQSQIVDQHSYHRPGECHTFLHPSFSISELISRNFKPMHLFNYNNYRCRKFVHLSK